jgi:hypothetical protein
LRVAATTEGATERMETSRRQNTAFTPKTVVHKMKKLKMKKQVEHERRKKKVTGSKNGKKRKI